MRVRLRSANRLLVMALTVMATVSSAPLALAQPATKSTFEREPLVSAKRFSQERNYPAFWDVLWEAAKSGDQAALSMLVSSVTMLGLVPPGVSPEAVDENRQQIFAFMLYVADSEDGLGSASFVSYRKALIVLLQTHTGYINENGVAVPRCARPDERLRGCPQKSSPPLPFDIEDRMILARCYIDEPTSKGCLDKAIALSIVAPFSEFAAKLDRRAAETGIAARCQPRPHGMCDDEDKYNFLGNSQTK